MRADSVLTTAWLRDHPADRFGEPYYTPVGRTKTRAVALPVVTADTLTTN